MKSEIFNQLKTVADYNGLSVTELITKELKPVDLEKEFSLVSFDNGQTYYKWIELYCLYVDLNFQIYLDNYIG